MSSIMAVCNLSVEMGGRFGIIAPDAPTLDYLRERPYAPTGALWERAVAQWGALHGDDDAVFDREVRIDASGIGPQNDIAKKLGVTKAALYTYVPSKEDLLYYCHDWAMDGAFESLEHARGAGGTGLEKLHTLQHCLEQMLMEGCAFVVLLEENALKPAHAKAIIKRRDEFEVALRPFVTEGIADGSIVPCNEKIAVFLALGALNWVRKWYSPDGAWSAQLIAESLTQMIERGLATAQSSHLMPQVELSGSAT